MRTLTMLVALVHQRRRAHAQQTLRTKTLRPAGRRCAP